MHDSVDDKKTEGSLKDWSVCCCLFQIMHQRTWINIFIIDPARPASTIQCKSNVSQHKHDFIKTSTVYINKSSELTSPPSRPGVPKTMGGLLDRTLTCFVYARPPTMMATATVTWEAVLSSPDTWRASSRVGHRISTTWGTPFTLFALPDIAMTVSTPPTSGLCLSSIPCRSGRL